MVRPRGCERRPGKVQAPHVGPGQLQPPERSRDAPGTKGPQSWDPAAEAAEHSPPLWGGSWVSAGRAGGPTPATVGTHPQRVSGEVKGTETAWIKDSPTHPWAELGWLGRRGSGAWSCGCRLCPRPWPGSSQGAGLAGRQGGGLAGAGLPEQAPGVSARWGWSRGEAAPPGAPDPTDLVPSAPPGAQSCHAPLHAGPR